MADYEKNSLSLAAAQVHHDRGPASGPPLAYDGRDDSYNGLEAGVTTSYVMKVSANGQVSIPAEARSRWHADRVVVVDLGDRVVVRPLPVDPIGDLEGAYRGKGPSTRRARQQARAEEAAATRHKTT